MTHSEAGAKSIYCQRTKFKHLFNQVVYFWQYFNSVKYWRFILLLFQMFLARMLAKPAQMLGQVFKYFPETSNKSSLIQKSRPISHLSIMHETVEQMICRLVPMTPSFFLFLLHPSCPFPGTSAFLVATTPTAGTSVKLWTILLGTIQYPNQESL